MHLPYENIDHDVKTTLICITTHLRVSLYAIISVGKVEMMASGLKGSGVYGVKTITTHILKERRKNVSVSDALQLMLAFGTFVLALIGLVVELIKLINKK